MHKTLKERLKFGPLQERHFDDEQRLKQSLSVVVSNVKLWSDSNSRSLAYIAALLDDVKNRHGSLHELIDEVAALQNMVSNQVRELAELDVL